MANHPYQSLPDWHFWKPSIAEVPDDEVDPVVAGKFRIGRTDRIATAGSCFAQHIARHLQGAGFNYLVTETANPVIPADIAAKYGYGLFTARYGNIYTSRQLLQLLQRTYGLFQPADDVWSRLDGRLVDPFRPRLQPDGFVSKAEYDADRHQHFAAVRRAIETLDVLVFTLGLTEGWVSRIDGAAYPLCPGVAGGSFDEKEHSFVNLRVEEIIADLRTSVQFIRERNPRARFVLTVSPVPLVATAEPRSVLVSTVYSKSVLRVAAEEIARDDDGIAYFPSYEIITGSHTRGRYFAEDLRSVTEDGVARVMQLFFTHYVDPAPVELGAIEKPPPSTTDHQRHRASITQAVSVMCDEVALDPSRRTTAAETGSALSAAHRTPRPDGPTEAVKNCIAAAERGQADAQFRLGVLYCTGNEIPQDLAGATRWYRLAAEQGHSYAAHNLAVMLLKGDGVDRDLAAAYRWSARAAEQGVPEAQRMLGDLYSGGLGTAPDSALARFWYERAAVQGNSIAAARLGALERALGYRPSSGNSATAPSVQQHFRMDPPSPHWHGGCQLQPATVSSDIAPPSPGNAVLKHIRDAPSIVNDSNVGWWQLEMVRPLQTCTASCFIYLPQSFNGDRVILSLGEPSGRMVEADISKRREWQRLSMTLTLPLGTPTFNLVLRVISTSETVLYSSAWRVDRASLVPVTVAVGD